MTPDDLKGLSLEAKFLMAGQFAGVAPKVIDGIYATESSRGKHLVSPAGALGPFQIMPETAATWSKRLGRTLNPMDFDDGLTIAAYQMKENLRATNDVPDALRMYNAGTNRARWDNPETNAYVGKVLGRPSKEYTDKIAAEPVHFNPDFVTADPTALIYGRNAVSAPSDEVRTKEAKPTEKQLDAAAVGGLSNAAPDLGGDVAREAQASKDISREFDAQHKIIGTNRFGVGIERGSFLAKMGAAVDQTITASVTRSFDRHVAGWERDPNFGKWLSANVDQVREDGEDQNGFNMLIKSGNRAEYDTTLQQLKNSRKLMQGAEYSGATEQTLYGFGAGLVTDPVGVAGGAGVGEAFSGFGVGGRALMSAGRYGRGLAMHSLEGTVGNVSMTALLQASGENEGVNDYFMAAVTGGGLGLAMGGVDLATVNKPKLLIDENTRQTLDEASAELGPDVPAEDVVRLANQKQAAGAKQTYEAALYSESDHTFMPRDANDVLLDTEAKKKAAAKESGNANTVNAIDRNVHNEIIEHAKVIDKAIKVSKDAMRSLVSWLPDAESAGLTLLKSDNVVFRSVGKVLLESTTGAAGRRVNAAMVKHVHEQRLLSTMAGWSELENHYVMNEGYGLISDEFNKQRGRKAFQREVYLEIERRRQGKQGTDHQTVKAAADMYEKAMQLSADIQRGAGTAGNLRLPESSRGYAQRLISVEKLHGILNKDVDAEAAIIDAIADQLADPKSGNTRSQLVEQNGRLTKITADAFDEKFARKVAKRYLDHARNKMAGKGSVSINMHDSDATATLRETLKAMSDDIDADEVEKYLGRFSRGGAAWTKGRLKLDLLKPITDGNGGTQLLADIFDHDLERMFRRQASRVSGEAGLAKHNIIGLAGITALRDAAIQTGIDNKGLKAFDHVMSEFMGFPVGDHAGKRIAAVEDLMVATSAARLGLASFNQMGEYGVALNTIGLARVGSAIAAIPRMIREVREFRQGKVSSNPILRGFDDLATFVGGEDYQHQGLFGQQMEGDVEIAGKENLSLFGRMARMGAKAQYIVSFHRKLVAVQSRGLSEQLLVRAFQFIRDGKSDVNLRDMGLSDELMSSIRGKLDKVATFNSKGQLKELHTEHLTGPELLELQTALYRGAGQMIQRTFIGETGPWVNNSILKMLYQFRRVGIVAMEKQTVRDLANKGFTGAFAGLLTGWALGMPLHLARTELRSLGMSESKRKEYLEKNANPTALAFASLNYATKSGLLADALQIGAGTIALTGNQQAQSLYSAISGGSRAGSRPFIGGTVAPALGTVNDAFSGKPDRMLKLLPGSNLIYLQPAVNAIGAATDDDR